MLNSSYHEPGYLETAKQGLLPEKIEQALNILNFCVLCPRKCKVNRLASKGKLGICKTRRNAYVSSYHAHFGEETPLVGRQGSGTIFFTHCGLLCNFCQNYEISHMGEGSEVSDAGLADIMLFLQKQGCHNINFVTPSHVVPQIIAAVALAVEQGLSIPLIYNTSGYDSVDTLKLLEGVIDIYMPDFKFWDSHTARLTCQAADYPEVARQAILEMHRQVGDLVIDEEGLAKHGLLVRHLVLPKGYAGTREIMRFISKNVSPNTYVNIMPQYRPHGKVFRIKELADYLQPEEYVQALQMAHEEGIMRLDSRPRRFFLI